MGSTGYMVPLETDTHRFVLDTLRQRHLVVAHCRAALGARRQGGWSYALYAAVADRTGAPVTVTAHVLVYLRLHRGVMSEIIVKHLHEHDEPGAHEGVTRRVLAALTPTEHPAARRWREEAIGHHRARTAARRAAREAVGNIIRLDRSYTYGPGVGAVRDVLVCSATRWRRARIAETGVVVEGPLLRAPTHWAQHEFEILRAPCAGTPSAPQPPESVRGNRSPKSAG